MDVIEKANSFLPWSNRLAMNINFIKSVAILPQQKATRHPDRGSCRTVYGPNTQVGQAIQANGNQGNCKNWRQGRGGLERYRHEMKGEIIEEIGRPMLVKETKPE